VPPKYAFDIVQTRCGHKKETNRIEKCKKVLKVTAKQEKETKTIPVFKMVLLDRDPLF